jgi:hypothetical protein
MRVFGGRIVARGTTHRNEPAAVSPKMLRLTVMASDHVIVPDEIGVDLCEFRGQIHGMLRLVDGDDVTRVVIARPALGQLAALLDDKRAALAARP